VTRYIFDTNVYIRAWRESGARQLELDDFFQRHATITYLSSVVYHELLVGANGPAMARDLSTHVAHPFLRTKRVITPSHRAWVIAAEAITDLVRTSGLDRRNLPRGFANDALIAASCRENGLTLVTENERDFRHLQEHIDFSFLGPWPA
jgi:predicted nucleic acid-binding protein